MSTLTLLGIPCQSSTKYPIPTRQIRETHRQHTRRQEFSEIRIRKTEIARDTERFFDSTCHDAAISTSQLTDSRAAVAILEVSKRVQLHSLSRRLLRERYQLSVDMSPRQIHVAYLQHISRLLIHQFFPDGLEDSNFLRGNKRV